MRSLLVYLDYDGAKLASQSAGKGAALPDTWSFDHNLPVPGDLRLAAVDPAGIGQPINGTVFAATFTIDASVSEGDIPIRVVLAEVRDDSNLALNITVITGVVTVTP